MSNVSESYLRGIFIDITKGYSVGKYGKDEVKIKHLNLEDQSKIDIFRDEYYNYAVKLGIPTEKERLEVLAKQGFWTKFDEDKIFAAENFVKRLRQTLEKTNLPSQRAALEDSIRVEEEKMKKLRDEKIQFIGKTAEVYAEKKLNEHFIYFSIRKYKDIDKNYYSFDDFNELEDDEIAEMINCFVSACGKINSNSIRRIALQPFFQSYFYLTDSISDFWGKKILDLTIFQSDLSYWGNHFRQIIKNSENKIPQDILTDPDELIKFFNLSSEAQKTMSNAKGELGSSSNPNMKQEDYEKMGIKVENPESIWARKLGRSLTGREVAEIRSTGTLKIKS